MHLASIDGAPTYHVPHTGQDAGDKEINPESAQRRSTGCLVGVAVVMVVEEEEYLVLLREK